MNKYSKKNHQIINELRTAGIKCTPAAINILEVLWASNQPDDVPQINSRLKVKINTATVYRILDKLVEAKLINKLKFNEQKSFYELNLQPHNHFVCANCHKVIDIYLDNKNLEQLKKVVIRNYKVNVETASINFTGVCNNC